MNEIKAKALRAVQLMNLHERQEIARNPAAATKKAAHLLAFGMIEDCTNEQFAVALQAAAADSLDLKLVKAPGTPDANPATAALFGGSLSSPPQPLGESPAPRLPPPPPPPPSIQVELSGLHQDLLKLDDALNSLVTDLDPILRPPQPTFAAGNECPAPDFAGSSLLSSVLTGRRHAQKLLADVQALRDQINL